MTTIDTAINAGHAIAREYWRRTPHVYSNGYPVKEYCALCDLTQQFTKVEDQSNRLLHIEPTPKPQTVIAEVIVGGTSGHFFTLKPSCGHSGMTVQVRDLRKRTPQVGDAFDCWPCDEQWQDINHPGLPREITAQIETLAPVCPRCGEPVYFIPFVELTTHDITFETDAQTGEFTAESMLNNRFEERPEWYNGLASRDADGWTTGRLEVSCKNKHDFVTNQLAWKEYGSEHHWKVLPTQ